MPVVPRPRAVVLDTNIVLDLLVFQDTATLALRQALHDGGLRWLASAPMRAELQRVLGYAQIVPRLQHYGLQAAAVLGAFDRLAQPVAVAPKVPVTCKDADDQPFVDLAAAHQALLLSKDRAVLALARRLQPWGVQTCDVFVS